MEGYHRSVLLGEAIDALEVKNGKWYLDLTLGDGGHSLEILRQGGKVVGIDVDPEALKRAKGRLGELGKSGKFVLIQGNFRDVKNLIQPHFAKATRGEQTELKDRKFDGAIFDLGVSSLQLMSPERGFSFGNLGPLDMRMDPGLQVQALDLVNALSRKELYELFHNLGEEKYSRQLADAVVCAREVRTGIKTTKDLADLVEREYRRFGIRGSKVHPATRIFQALRIVVNDELEALKEGLEQVKDLIEKNGRIVVISFHSLEDRIAKNTFKNWQSEGVGEIITKKPIVPGEEEVRGNPRSRSAKMRVFEKL